MGLSLLLLERWQCLGHNLGHKVNRAERAVQGWGEGSWFVVFLPMRNAKGLSCAKSSELTRMLVEQRPDELGEGKGRELFP